MHHRTHSRELVFVATPTSGECERTKGRRLVSNYSDRNKVFVLHMCVYRMQQDSDDDDSRFRRVAQSLACNDKHRRVQALALVEMWLSRHVSHAEPIELSKLCRALFYAIWLSDDPEVTEQTTAQVAKYIRIGTGKYFKALFDCVGSLWPKLDQYRMDKFYDLITYCLDQVAAISDEAHWSGEQVGELFGVLHQQLTHQQWIQQSKGICLHIIDKYYAHILRRALSFLVASSRQETTAMTSNHPQVNIDLVFHTVVNDAILTDHLLATRTKEKIFASLVEDCQTASSSTDSHRDFILYMRQWLPQLYTFAGSPQRPTKARKMLYSLYSRLKNILGEPNAVPVRRSIRLQQQGPTENKEAVESNPQVVKQVRFSLDKNEEYILPAPKPRKRPTLQKRKKIRRTVSKLNNSLQSLS